VSFLDDGDVLFVSSGAAYRAPTSSSSSGGGSGAAAAAARKRGSVAARANRRKASGLPFVPGSSASDLGRGIVAQGDIVGGYRVGRLLGLGGFGEVRLGTHCVSGDEAAIKFLPFASGGGGDGGGGVGGGGGGGGGMSAADAERVTTEISCLSELQHTHVIRLFQVVTSPTYVALVLEYAPGGDLRGHLEEVLRRRAAEQAERDVSEWSALLAAGLPLPAAVQPRPPPPPPAPDLMPLLMERKRTTGRGKLLLEASDFPPPAPAPPAPAPPPCYGVPESAWAGMEEADARSRFLQVVRGMAYAHGKHIIHRDLKLDNVLVGAGGDMKITDFGLSQYTAPGAGDGAGANTGASGSLYYMAPETLASRPVFGPGVDVWAAGVLLYALLTGRLPFASPAVLRAEAMIRADAAIAAAAEVVAAAAASSSAAVDAVVGVDEQDPTTAAAAAAAGDGEQATNDGLRVVVEGVAAAQPHAPPPPRPSAPPSRQRPDGLGSSSWSVASGDESDGGSSHSSLSMGGGGAVAASAAEAGEGSTRVPPTPSRRGKGGKGKGAKAPPPPSTSSVPGAAYRDFFMEAERTVETTTILRETRAAIIAGPSSAFFPASLSPPVVSLLRAMLCVDPVQRLEMVDVLSHPWLNGHTAAMLMRAPGGVQSPGAEGTEEGEGAVGGERARTPDRHTGPSGAYLGGGSAGAGTAGARPSADPSGAIPPVLLLSPRQGLASAASSSSAALGDGSPGAMRGSMIHLAGSGAAAALRRARLSGQSSSATKIVIDIPPSSGTASDLGPLLSPPQAGASAGGGYLSPSSTSSSISTLSAGHALGSPKASAGGVARRAQLHVAVAGGTGAGPQSPVPAATTTGADTNASDGPTSPAVGAYPTLFRRAATAAGGLRPSALSPGGASSRFLLRSGTSTVIDVLSPPSVAAPVAASSGELAEAPSSANPVSQLLFPAEASSGGVLPAPGGSGTAVVVGAAAEPHAAARAAAVASSADAIAFSTTIVSGPGSGGAPAPGAHGPGAPGSGRRTPAPIASPPPSKFSKMISGAVASPAQPLAQRPQSSASPASSSSTLPPLPLSSPTGRHGGKAASGVASSPRGAPIAGGVRPSASGGGTSSSSAASSARTGPASLDMSLLWAPVRSGPGTGGDHPPAPAPAPAPVPVPAPAPAPSPARASGARSAPAASGKSSLPALGAQHGAHSASGEASDVAK
jgi:serine/threonine protein kinase